MVICFHFGGQQHCFTIPIVEWPIVFRKPDPGPVNYPAFFSDAVLVASLQELARKISDQSVRQAVEHGLGGAVAAMQKHIGGEVAIKA